ncbi:hypothetical protein SNEBB_009034 [Seison nebaliae]|nr:hypothetical protein SNEBB_009034 [Seison nebaliae]
MKIVGKHIDKNANGSVSFICENSDDIWNSYNLINVGDEVRTMAVRKVQQQQNSTVNTGNTMKVNTYLTVSVEEIEFDSSNSSLRVKGRNIEENQYVKKGAYHTLDIIIQRKFRLNKSCWDSFAHKRLKEITSGSQYDDNIGAILMHEGLANICLITRTNTNVLQKIDSSISKKRRGFTSQYEKSLERFFKQIVHSIKRCFAQNISQFKAIIIASPGFLKESFLKFFFEYCETHLNEYRDFVQDKSKYILCHTSNGFKHSLQTILNDPVIQNRLQGMMTFNVVHIWNNFIQLLNNDSDRAIYGNHFIRLAVDQEAIDDLLLTDNLFRSKDYKIRQFYVELLEDAEKIGSRVHIFSSFHINGEELNKFSGIAAILRFPIHESVIEEELPMNDQFEKLKVSLHPSPLTKRKEVSEVGRKQKNYNLPQLNKDGGRKQNVIKYDLNDNVPSANSKQRRMRTKERIIHSHFNIRVNDKSLNEDNVSVSSSDDEMFNDFYSR